MGSQKINCNKEVLFQKIGDTWFIFSEIAGDLIYSAMPKGMDPRATQLELYEVIDRHLAKKAHLNPPLAEAA